ncbi:MAG: M24 family metallopeptidase [Odoribacter sp.]|nr:M24 family metallopeptidase [Odoribacter sp.]
MVGKNVAQSLTETEVADKLTQFRSECKDYFSDSFHTISAYGKNAALPHYSAIAGKDAVLLPKGLYLVDSGGQYPYGTTDITRTIRLGEISELEREDYTLVLKGMIGLSNCIFPKGTTGSNIDILARNPLWQNLRNFGHGTGHGIGHFLCVHEKPQDIRQTLKDQPLLPGMITSNEPGMYRENLHGIRHENMILCKKIAENEFGEWLGFETLTLCYFDTSALKTEIMTGEEIGWLNEYHKIVYEKLSPFLNEDEKEWLKTKTQSI